MLLATAALGATLAFARTELGRARELDAEATTAIQAHDPVWATILLRREILLLPRTPEYDHQRHALMLRLGETMLAATGQTSDPGFASDARRMLRRYRIVYDELFGTDEAAQPERREIDELLGRVELELEKPHSSTQVEWLPPWMSSITVASVGLTRALAPSHSLYEWVRKRTRARAAFAALQPELRRCYARGVMRTPIRYITTTLELTVDPDGRLASAHILGDPLVDADGNACVEDSVRRVHFAGERTSAPLRVLVPVMFRWGGCKPGRWLGLDAR